MCPGGTGIFFQQILPFQWRNTDDQVQGMLLCAAISLLNLGQILLWCSELLKGTILTIWKLGCSEITVLLPGVGQVMLVGVGTCAASRSNENF